MANSDHFVRYNYRFQLPDGTEKHFKLELDAETLTLGPTTSEERPRWTDLIFKQCENCPLTPQEHPACPVAHQLAGITDEFEDVQPAEVVRVEVQTAQRVVLKETTIEIGLRSLIGIIMVSSGCPHLDQLRPMVRFHLPFATVDETIFRATSNYLLLQYFHHVRSEDGDWNLEGLSQLYAEIGKVNAGLADRLRRASHFDVNLEALASLDVFAKILPLSISTSLHRLHYLFPGDGE